MVVLCAVTIGVEADWSIKHATDDGEKESIFETLDFIFNSIFCVELCLRLGSDGFSHFLSVFNPAVKWNILDFTLVSSAVAEELAKLVASRNGSSGSLASLRILRLMRLVRVARILRVLRFFSELRVMVNGIMGSARLLLWALVLLSLVMFVFGVTIIQLIQSYIKDGGPADVLMSTYYGSLPRTMMTLYMAISGGLDWRDAVLPLDPISPQGYVDCDLIHPKPSPMKVVRVVLVYVFSGYIFFTVFCCLNIVTGIFVDNAKAHDMQQCSKNSTYTSYTSKFASTSNVFEQGSIFVLFSDAKHDAASDWRVRFTKSVYLDLMPAIHAGMQLIDAEADAFSLSVFVLFMDGCLLR
ncbi:unnamed protein product [Polarella glacialis]|uniref:Ion transport domain-containing protein n=1 Tax=Polarella glacialis TaxID=89957 RepID=A0A813JEB8_POLGL|nr:unnamed protein product [Polarella glacialis]